jgi:hypothetical protein
VVLAGVVPGVWGMVGARRGREGDGESRGGGR